MALRSLLSDYAYNDLITVPSANVTATGTPKAGREPYRVVEQRLHTCWEVPKSGPHRLTMDHVLSFGTGPHIIVLCAHPERDFTGTVTVRLRASPGGADVWSSTTSFRPAEGFTDRRYFVVPGTTNARYLQVVLSTGNLLSYAAKFRAINLTGMLNSSPTLRPIDSLASQELAAGGFVWETAKAASPGRRIKRDIRLPAVPATTFQRLFAMFDRFGRSEPALWLPDAEDDTAQTSAIEFMHATSVFGQLDSDFSFSFTGTGTAVDDAGVTSTGSLRSGTLSIESWP